MSGDEETRDDEWGNAVARKTFIVTLISALVFAGAVALFILNADPGR